MGKAETALMAMAIILVLGIGLVAKLSGLDRPVPQRSRVKNVIMMIADGYGPGGETLARSYHQNIQRKASKAATPLPLDAILVGTVATHSASHPITDSAAAGTAYSCGFKTVNHYVGVTTTGEPCGTVLEAAKWQKNKKTGLIATTRITHATPASFSAHVLDRFNETLIAEQQIGLDTVDVLLGGGLKFFVGQEEPGSGRVDDWDGLKAAKDKGFDIVQTAEELRQFHVSLQTEEKPVGKFLGLFAPSHFNFKIERPPEQPTLLEMTKVAIDVLTKDNPNGFFLMIEGSRIDQLAHRNDAAGYVREILEYQEVVQYVLNWMKQNGEDETALISTSDHETGGLTLGYERDYAIYPPYNFSTDLLEKVNISTEALRIKLTTDFVTITNPQQRYDYVVDLLQTHHFITPTREEVEKILHVYNDAEMLDISPERLEASIGDPLAHALNIGWTTSGHSGIDVNLYAKIPPNNMGIQQSGWMDNTHVNNILSSFLGVNLPEATRVLSQRMVEHEFTTA